MNESVCNNQISQTNFALFFLVDQQQELLLMMYVQRKILMENVQWMIYFKEVTKEMKHHKNITAKNRKMITKEDTGFQITPI